MNRSSPIEAARDLAPLAAERAAESERLRRLTDDLAAAIVDAGLYRLCVPASLGGAEAEPRVLVEAVEALAAGDGAAGWCVAVCATSGMLAAYLGEEAAAEVYGDPRGAVGGVFAPKGRAVAGDRGFRVDGRWPFASNCEACGWLMGGCVVLEDGQPRELDSGRPDIRLLLFPAGDVEIVDTWSVSGLRATGSHDIAVAALEVPAARSASLITDRPREPGPLYAFPPFGLLAISIASVALGIARGALDDLRDLAGAKTPTLSSRRLAERADTQSRVAQAEAALAAARLLLLDEVGAAWEAARGGAALALETRAALRRAATHATATAAAAVDAAYHLAGGSAIYETGALQRRFRDVHAATQHMVVGPATWEVTGRVLLGLPTDAEQV